LEYLSDIELYYSEETDGNNLVISGEEKNHIVKVMRHSEGDIVYITNGLGKIFIAEIIKIDKDLLKASVKEAITYNNEYANISFCIPKLRNPERFEFALEKCTELGITNFIIFDAMRGVSRGEKKDRWEKIVISAMKQSLRSYKPVITFIKDIGELSTFNGEKIILDQSAEAQLSKEVLSDNKNYYIIFGPEGGLDKTELNKLDNYTSYKTSPNRLRSETAIIKTASIITF